VNGAHDLGGSQGFGPVPIERDEPVFHEEWERRVFGISFALWGRIGSVDDFRYARERMHPEEYLAASYYEKWLAAAERLAVERGVITTDELEKRRRVLEGGEEVPRQERRDPELARRLVDSALHGVSSLRAVDREPRFAAGDEIVARNFHPAGHTRLPRYLRGRRGVVKSVLGAFVFPDARAAGQGEQPEHCYTVRFEAHELWGDSAEPRASVWLDLWESYLRPLEQTT
jgi:nitrile hydratase beta subunit